LGTKIDVSKAQQKVDFAELDAVKKVANRRGLMSGLTNGWSEVFAGRDGVDWTKTANQAVVSTLSIPGAGQVAAGVTDRQQTFNDKALQDAITKLGEEV
jgi:hypothetical protein